MEVSTVGGVCQDHIVGIIWNTQNLGVVQNVGVHEHDYWLTLCDVMLCVLVICSSQCFSCRQDR